MVRERMSAEDALEIISTGRRRAEEKQIVHDFDLPGGAIVTIAWTSLRRYREDLAAARIEAEEELFARLGKADSARTYEEKLTARREFLAGNEETIKTAAYVRVVSRQVTNLYDPSISTPDDPALTMRWLVNAGVPIPEEDYEPDRQVAVTPELIAAAITTSAMIENLVSAKMFNLEAFYEEKKRREEGNSGPSRRGGAEVGSPAPYAKPNGSARCRRKSSGGSTPKNVKRSSADGNTGS